jgi:DnaK suppressor protein
MTSNQKLMDTEIPAGLSPRHDEKRARQLQDLLAGVRSREMQRMRAMRERGSLDLSTQGDEGDTAASDEHFEMTASMAELAGSRVAAVQSALRRLQDGNYGLCEECGEEIPIERLQALPAAVLCVDCQREREVASKQNRSESLGLWVNPTESPSLTAEDEVVDEQARTGGRRGPDASRRTRGRPKSVPREQERARQAAE